MQRFFARGLEQQAGSLNEPQKKPEQKVEKKNKSKDACANLLTWS
jgi:hypothetical protein